MVGTLFVGLAYVLGWILVKVLQSLGWVLGKGGRLIGWGVRGAGKLVAGVVVHVSRFVRNELVDGLHTAGGALTATVIAPLALLNLALGRWSAARHYGTALEDEVVSAGRSFYRFVLGNPIRFVGLGVLTSGLENRVPSVIDRAPREAGRTSSASFPGYKIVGTLAAALPPPSRATRAREAHRLPRGHAGSGKRDQVVRARRRLDGPDTSRDASSRIREPPGLVLSTSLPAGFHYVMPYASATTVADAGMQRTLHRRSRPQGPRARDGYAADLLRSLHRFHTNGCGTDIKPNN
jgi:hypothetical protein